MQLVVLDPRNSFKPSGAVQHGVFADPNTRGWEVPGDVNNLTANKPYVEGSWAIQRTGRDGRSRYYWMYSSPGTQYLLAFRRRSACMCLLPDHFTLPAMMCADCLQPQIYMCVGLSRALACQNEPSCTDWSRVMCILYTGTRVMLMGCSRHKI